MATPILFTLTNLFFQIQESYWVKDFCMSFTLNLAGFLPPSPARTLSAPRLLSEAGQPRLGFLLPIQEVKKTITANIEILKSSFIRISFYVKLESLCEIGFLVFLFEPTTVFDIVVCNPVDLPFNQFLRNILYFFGGNTCKNASRWHMCTF